MSERPEPPKPLDLNVSRVSSQAFKQFQGRDFRIADFEETAAENLIKALKLPADIKREIYEYAGGFGRVRPWLEDVREVVVNMPIYPVADQKVNLRDNAGLSSLFPIKKFTKLPLVKRFLELQQYTEADRGGKPLVVIFKWPYIESGVVLHALPHDPQVPGIRFIYDAPHDPQWGEFSLTIEPIEQLVQLLHSYGT